MTMAVMVPEIMTNERAAMIFGPNSLVVGLPPPKHEATKGRMECMFGWSTQKSQARHAPASCQAKATTRGSSRSYAPIMASLFHYILYQSLLSIEFRGLPVLRIGYMVTTVGVLPRM